MVRLPRPLVPMLALVAALALSACPDTPSKVPTPSTGDSSAAAAPTNSGVVRPPVILIQGSTIPAPATTAPTVTAAPSPLASTDRAASGPAAARTPTPQTGLLGPNVGPSPISDPTARYFATPSPIPTATTTT